MPNSINTDELRNEIRLKLVNIIYYFYQVNETMELIDAYTKAAEPLLESERFELATYRKEHETALEDFHEFGKAPVGSPERMAAYISHLSSWNLKNGAEALKEWREAAVRGRTLGRDKSL